MAPRYISETPTEVAIRSIMNGLLVDDKCACYLGFDLSIKTDDSYDVRDVRIGIHLLRWRVRIIGCADDDFLFPKFCVHKEWEEISAHGSCWPDSTMGFINRVIQDVMENKGASKFVKGRYDDELNFDLDVPNCSLFLQECQLLDIEDIKDVIFNNHDDEKRRLVSKSMLEDILS